MIYPTNSALVQVRRRVSNSSVCNQTCRSQTTMTLVNRDVRRNNSSRALAARRRSASSNDQRDREGPAPKVIFFLL